MRRKIKDRPSICNDSFDHCFAFDFFRLRFSLSCWPFFLAARWPNAYDHQSCRYEISRSHRKYLELWERVGKEAVYDQFRTHLRDFAFAESIYSWRKTSTDGKLEAIAGTGETTRFQSSIGREISGKTHFTMSKETTFFIL